MGELSSFVYVFTLKKRMVFLSMIVKKMKITQPQSNREGWVRRGGTSSEVTSTNTAAINTTDLSLGQKVKNWGAGPQKTLSLGLEKIICPKK